MQYQNPNSPWPAGQFITLVDVSATGGRVYYGTLQYVAQGVGTVGFFLQRIIAAFGSSSAPTSTEWIMSFAVAPHLDFGKVLIVDSAFGDDTYGSRNGIPFLTLQAANAAAQSGEMIWMLPGTYTLTSELVVKDNISIRGISLQSVIIQCVASTDVTMITMGENCRVEDVTITLTSSGHYNLTGIQFAGTSCVTSKLRNCVVTLDNSAASSTGNSNALGILFSGTGSIAANSFSFNCVKGCTITVNSNGGGVKRGLYINNSNIVTLRDTNVSVSAPRTTTSTGSYVGVEVNDPTYNLGSIQLRSATIGAPRVGLGSFTASDILQTTPSTIADPTYLASSGIQVGPGTDLVTKSAGGRGFSTFIYPTTIFYGLKGNIKTASQGYLWVGTQAVSNNNFPDTTFPPAHYRIQQPAILSGLSASLNGSCTSNHSLTLNILCTPANTALTNIIDTSISVGFGGSEVFKTYYNTSYNFNTGDRLLVLLSYTGGNANEAHDLTLQVDMF